MSAVVVVLLVFFLLLIMTFVGLFGYYMIVVKAKADGGGGGEAGGGDGGDAGNGITGDDLLLAANMTPKNNAGVAGSANIGGGGSAVPSTMSTVDPNDKEEVQRVGCMPTVFDGGTAMGAKPGVCFNPVDGCPLAIMQADWLIKASMKTSNIKQEFLNDEQTIAESTSDTSRWVKEPYEQNGFCWRHAWWWEAGSIDLEKVKRNGKRALEFFRQRNHQVDEFSDSHIAVKAVKKVLEECNAYELYVVRAIYDGASWIKGIDDEYTDMIMHGGDWSDNEMSTEFSWHWGGCEGKDAGKNIRTCALSHYISWLNWTHYSLYDTLEEFLTAVDSKRSDNLKTQWATKQAVVSTTPADVGYELDITKNPPVFEYVGLG